MNCFSQKIPMKSPREIAMLLLVAILGGQATIVKSVPYDYSATTECYTEPWKPHYGGGIIKNPKFDNKLEGWVSTATVAHKVSKSGNKYGVALDRSKPQHSLSQKFKLQKDNHYVVSAWLQVDTGTADVRVSVKSPEGFQRVGMIKVKSSCWSMVKGGFTAKSAGPAEIFFESNTTSEVWVDNISVQPFTEEEWRGHHNETINQARKKIISLQAVDGSGNAVAGAKYALNSARPAFPFGNAISGAIVTNPDYQKWFASRGFTVATFENEMKWYGTEYTQGHEDYTVADQMLAFAKKCGVQVRGHNVFWNDPASQMGWVNKLNKAQLQEAVNKRLKSVVNRYKGQVIHWDVNNENVHFNFFETKLGADASTKLFQQVHQIDPNVILFMNEFNTLEQPGDPNATPDKYLKKFNEIRAGNPNAKMAIGLESHFDEPNIPYMRSVLDKMATAGVPIWLTEVDVGGTTANHAKWLEQILREGYAHPAVKGIVMWASWTPKGCYRMCLTDNSFKNYPVGDLVDSLIKEWNTKVSGTTGADGSALAHVVHGQHTVTVIHPSGKRSMHEINVHPDSHPVHKLVIDH